MAFSYVDYTANGAQIDFVYNLGYISKNHISVLLDGELIPSSGYTWITNEIIRVTPAPALGKKVRIARNSSQTATLVTFTNNSSFNAGEMNLAFIQAFMMAQEALDRPAIAAEAGGGSVPTPTPGADDGKVLGAANGSYAWSRYASLNTLTVSDFANINDLRVADQILFHGNDIGTPWGSLNQGAGTGMSADLLDDLHASDFLRSNAADVYKDATATNKPDLAKAWVSFNASTGTPTILKSYNVASITDNGVGDYTINFTNPLPANYVVSGISQPTVVVSNVQCQVAIHTDGSTNFHPPASCRIRTGGGTGGTNYGHIPGDNPFNSFVFFGSN